MNFEKQSQIMNRRRLIAIGAVLVASSVLVSQRIPPNQLDFGLSRDNHDISPANHEKYFLHENIITTIFWAGEKANKNTNDGIHNLSSFWVLDWVTAYGGVDDPDDRCGFHPCDFTPKENPFYFALPFGDYNERGLKPASELEAIPWYDGKIQEGESILKNRWVEIAYKDKKAYAQWEDVGPFGEDDSGYVFGSARPEEPRAGLDVSPAVAVYLGIDGRAETSWRFVEKDAVPDGPWRQIITTSGPQW